METNFPVEEFVQIFSLVSVVRGMEIINMVLHTFLIFLLSRIVGVDPDFIEKFVEKHEEGS